jgi:predicted alpha-1,6-mannanase (GH76 family)
MMINLRGTSGAGKSTVLTTFKSMVNAAGIEVTPVFREGRRQPWFYSAPAPRPWRLLGHYESPCGGCDTIKTVDEVYDLVRAGVLGGEAVLFEGIMVQDDVRRAVAFHKEFGDMVVIGLTTDIETCLSAIRDRRVARGDTRPLNEKNTRGRAASLERTLRRLEEGGVPVERLDRGAALTRVCRLMGLD